REIIFAGLPEAPESTATADGEPESAIVPAGALRVARKLDPSVTIGQIADVRDDGLWHSAEFDLLGALQKAGLATKVDALALAAPSSDYLQAGLGGNHRG